MTNLIKNNISKVAFLVLMLMVNISVNAKINKSVIKEEGNLTALLSKEIKSQLVYPASLIDENINEKVTIEFVINDNFTITPLNINCKNTQLKNIVEKQLSQIVLPTKYEAMVNKQCEISVIYLNTNF